MSLPVQVMPGPQLDLTACQRAWKSAPRVSGSNLRTIDLRAALKIAKSLHFVEYRFEEIQPDRERNVIRLIGFRWITLDGSVVADLVLPSPIDAELMAISLRRQDVVPVLRGHLLNYIGLCTRLPL